jgi:hypothetical protein
MVNPISSSSANSANEVEKQAARPQPPAQAATGSAVQPDKVTLSSTSDKSAGDPDHDGK